MNYRRLSFYYIMLTLVLFIATLNMFIQVGMTVCLVWIYLPKACILFVADCMYLFASGAKSIK